MRESTDARPRCRGSDAVENFEIDFPTENAQDHPRPQPIGAVRSCPSCAAPCAGFPGARPHRWLNARLPREKHSGSDRSAPNRDSQRPPSIHCDVVTDALRESSADSRHIERLTASAASRSWQLSRRSARTDARSGKFRIATVPSSGASAWRCRSWLPKLLLGLSDSTPLWFIVLGLAYPWAACVYDTCSRPRAGAVSCSTRFWSSTRLSSWRPLLIQDPETFAFLNPFLLVTVVRIGIRYGVSTFYLSWLVTLCASALLASSAFWRHETELALRVPAHAVVPSSLFSSLIRRIHNVRAIEQERAHFTPSTNPHSPAAPSSPKSATNCALPCKASSPPSTSCRCGAAPRPTPTTS